MRKQYVGNHRGCPHRRTPLKKNALVFTVDENNTTYTFDLASLFNIATGGGRLFIYGNIQDCSDNWPEVSAFAADGGLNLNNTEQYPNLLMELSPPPSSPNWSYNSNISYIDGWFGTSIYYTTTNSVFMSNTNGGIIATNIYTSSGILPNEVYSKFYE